MNARPPMPQSLPPALHGFTAFNQWLNYRLVPSTRTPGKMDKHPIGRGGYRVKLTEPTEWMSYEEAASLSDKVAFVFSKSDPFFFLDIDGAKQPDGSWSPVAQTLLGQLKGCAVEVSSSGTGLHIFGVGHPGEHGCKDKSNSLEFYTEDRFVALTGHETSGSVFFAPDPMVLASIRDQYFPPAEHKPATDWTDEPCEGWSGPEDDDELVRRASRHVSAAAAFAGKATFADLWNANEDALAEAFPDSGRPYDCNRADAALCAHLAWWTGKDCERMARLLRASGLARDKHDREDYVQRTILRACGLVTDVLQDRPTAQLPTPRPPAPVAVTDAAEAAPEVVEAQYLRVEQSAALFAGCVYIAGMNRVWMPNGQIFKPESFNGFFGGYQHILDEVGRKTTDEAFKAFTRHPMMRAPQVLTTCFDPKLAPGAIVDDFKGRAAVNTWIPPKVRCEPGDAGPFLRHLEKLLPVQRDRDILMAYLASVVQYPGYKFLWAPALQGVPGNGKSYFTRILQHAVGSEYYYAAPSSALGKDFNAWLDAKLLIAVDDVRIADDDMYERLKTLITEKTQPIERKGVDADNVQVYANFFFTMNSKTGLRKAADDRRFAVFFTAQQRVEDLVRDGMLGEYMVDLNDWTNGTGAYAAHGPMYGAAIVTHLLRSHVIPDDLNPTTLAHRAPRTSAHDEVVATSMGAREQEVQEAIDSGAIGFRGGWVSSHHTLLLLLKANDRRVRVSNLDEVLGNLGYVRHPGLKDGRTNNMVQPDGARSVLYVAKGRMDLLALEGAEAARGYTAAQTVAE